MLQATQIFSACSKINDAQPGIQEGRLSAHLNFTLGIHIMLITKHVIIYLKNIKEMPFLLRISCYGIMFATPIFPLFLLLPNAEVEFDGRKIGNPGLWSYGLSAAMAASMALVFFGFWGLMARKSNSRWLLVFSPLTPYIFWTALPSQLTAYDAVVSAALTAIALYVYLFHIKAVREYFEVH